jgi:hypothetical protein
MAYKKTFPSLDLQTRPRFRPVSLSLSMAGTYTRVEHLTGSSIGKAPAFPTNIRLGWKGFLRTNTLAYCKNSKLTAVKHFITI